MGKDLYEREEASKRIFDEADETLETKLSSLIFEGDAEELTLTYNAQPALLTTSIAVLEKFKESGITPDFTAGHSLGEYSALVAAGAMTFKDAVYTVRKRGEFMNEAVPAGEGAMAAILGMDAESLKKVTDQVTENGHLVQLANLNCRSDRNFRNGKRRGAGFRRSEKQRSKTGNPIRSKRTVPF